METAGRRAAAAPQPGSQRALREANEDRLLAVLHDGGAWSQADLVRVSGLSASTVSVTVRRLRAAGQVEVSTGTANGRRAVLVRAHRTRLAAGVDIGRTHVRILLGTSPHPTAGDVELQLPERHAPEDTIPLIADTLRELTAGSGESGVDCVGVGLPGPVDARRGVVTGGSILPTWVDRPLGAMLSEALGVEVRLQNDANLGALAISRSERPPAEDLLYVKVASGVGAGVVLGGRLMTGRSGLAGEIGHLPVAANGTQCRCGRRGCLETIASAESIRLALANIFERDVTNEDLVELARSGASGVVRRVVVEAGEALGWGLAAAASLLDPGLIVLGGPLTPLGDLLLEPVRQSFDRHALLGIASRTEIRLAPPDFPAEAVGALVLGLQRA